MIKIKKWSKYQSYKDRKPPWIRFHRSMLDNYEYQTMSAEARALLPMLWLLACENEDPTSGIIDQDIKKISFRLRQSVENIEYCLRELQVSDFVECIESVTESLQNSNESVTPETETETETEEEGGQVTPSSGKAPLPFNSTVVMNIWNEVMSDTSAYGKKLMDDTLRNRINNLTRNEFPTEDEWRKYFEALKTSDFLMGKTETRGRKPFRLSLEFAVRPSKMNNFFEGHYHG